MDSKKSFFPLFIDLTNKSCLIVGGGNIALRKLKNLVKYGARVTVIAPIISDEILEYDIEVKKRVFKAKDIKNRFLVVAATNKKNLNEMIVDICEDNNILVNNITSKNYMSARFSAHIDRKNYQIAISSKGEPRKSMLLKNKIDKFLNDEEKKELL